jgi:hypothetical protein
MGMEEKSPLGVVRRKREDSIKMDLKRVGREDVDFIRVAQEMDQWRALLNTLVNFRVP